MDKNLLFYVGFSHCLGIGPMKFDLLLKHFGTVERAYKADERELMEIFGGPILLEKFLQFRNEFNAEEKLKEFKKKEITVLVREDKRFPPSLMEISDPPICLYVKGDVGNFDFSKERLIAVVGTRMPTSYGKQITEKLSYDLALSGLVIVSGMAIGIDAAAHRAALDAKGKTIAILGCGVDLPSPPSNTVLYEQIIASGGLIMSEFPPGMTTSKGLFIARNRLISGISRGVLVVEGAKDSGALTTARFAAQQGREVFAAPGPITSRMSEAPNLLIREGAKLVSTLEDILQELQIHIHQEQRGGPTILLSENEQAIVDLLSREPKLTDEISEEVKISTSNTLQSLSVLEVKGVIEKNSEGKYQLR